MVFKRLRRVLAHNQQDKKQYRCISCGEEYARSHSECPGCGSPFLAPIDKENQNA